MKLLTILLVGAILRIVPILYLSRYESLRSYPPELKFTDIDYKVYTDAALLYDSPYQKHTYRYTPLISYAMKWNNRQEFAGKLIFVIGDLLAIIFLWKLTSKHQQQSLLTKLYAYNPFFIYITARGSCESFGMALMFCFLWLWYGDKDTEGNSEKVLVMDQRTKLHYWSNRYSITFRQACSYVIFGLWVHYRVYPVIFVPYLLYQIYRKSAHSSIMNASPKCFAFLAVSGATFLALGYVFYLKYGMPFIEESYLYHLNRKDNRHSFSPFFYEIYLNMHVQTLVRTLMRLIPQLYLLLVISFKLHLSPFTKFFLLTYSFVCFNRVITMQYYMWMFAALIPALPESQILQKKQLRKAVSLFMQWILGVSIWVWLSLRLEDKGENVFTIMWVCCIVKMFSQLWVLSGLLDTMKITRNIINPPKSSINQPAINQHASKHRNGKAKKL